MISSVDFSNFRVLRSAVLPLAPCTIIVGPNGSGKSTALRALEAAAGRHGDLSYERAVSVGIEPPPESVEITVHWQEPAPAVPTKVQWRKDPNAKVPRQPPDDAAVAARKAQHDFFLKRLMIFALTPSAIAAPVQIQPTIELNRNGGNLAGVLDHIKEKDPERFDALTAEFQRWVPEYDRILLPTTTAGHKGLRVRKRVGGHPIDARDLSDGTLFALALLTLTYLPDPPQIVCLEDVDHGLHPRLMHYVRDAMYRLAYPESCGDKRRPVQVIATTHSPHLLDFFKDHPEEVVIAEKRDTDAIFKRLSDYPHISEILGETSLGDIWYSGILGGVPAGT